jgi:hypothetical protein
MIKPQSLLSASLTTIVHTLIKLRRLGAFMKKLLIVASSLAGVAVLTASSMGIVSAATKNINIGTSGIPRLVFKQERLDAVSQVLNTTTTSVQTARKDKTLSELISNAGLTKKTFDQKVKTQLTSDLEAKGYSQDQVTIALQHRTIVKLHHKTKI